MKATDLNTQELLELDPKGGVIRFAGQRALLIDAVAMGMLRKYLIENFGITVARTVLTQFGFAHGWRMADALRTSVQWASDEEWRRAGPRMNELEGLYQVSPGGVDALCEEGAMLVGSYEVEQHMLHFGRTDEPVCWTISGLMSGYLSRTQDDDIFVVEDKCIASGDAGCHHVARSRSDWGEENANSLSFYESAGLKESLEVSLRRVTSTLQETERELRVRLRALEEIAKEEYQPSGLITRSRAMRNAVDMAKRVAPVDSTILILGESGSGKERIARLIHAESTRAGGPFIAVNCGAITETLLESELFGHTRGAFTGATHDRPGLFEAANGGTLLLDELGDVSPAMQLKLLRVLQEREVRRVGDNKSRSIDVRVLAATHHDLVALVADGDFREDLFYRIRVVEISVPPLRERREDLLVLARVLLAESSQRLKRKVDGLSPAAADQLLRHSWPGNVRELENAMERAVILARGSRVELEDLPEEVRSTFPARAIATGQVRRLEEIEKDYILAVLERNGGNQRVTAEQLGIGTATLYRRLKRYGETQDRVPPSKEKGGE